MEKRFISLFLILLMLVGFMGTVEAYSCVNFDTGGINPEGVNIQHVGYVNYTLVDDDELKTDYDYCSDDGDSLFEYYCDGNDRLARNQVCSELNEDYDCITFPDYFGEGMDSAACGDFREVDYESEFTGEEAYVTEDESEEDLNDEEPTEDLNDELPSELPLGIRHTADEIKINIKGAFYSLQNYVNDKEKAKLWQDRLEQHFARDIKVDVNEKEITLQSYIDQRYLEWNKIEHYSWEDGSNVYITLDGDDVSLQEAIDNGDLADILFPEDEETPSDDDDDDGEGEEGTTSPILYNEYISLKHESLDLYVSVHTAGDEWVKITEEKVENDDKEKFEIIPVGGNRYDELRSGEKVNIKSVENNKMLHAERDVIGRDWITARDEGKFFERLDLLDIIIKKQDGNEGDIINCGDKVYLIDADNENNYWDSQPRSKDNDREWVSADGTKNTFIIKFGDGKCPVVKPDEGDGDDDDDGNWIYRCYNEDTGDRMNSVDFDCEDEDYVRDTIQFKNYGNEGTLVLYRCYNSETEGHITTQSEDCSEAEGFSLENEIARVLQGPTDDAVPLYRCSKVKEGGLTDYMITDREDCEGAKGYTLDKGEDGTGDGIIGYAEVKQGPDGRADRTGPTEGFGDVVVTGNTITLYNEATNQYLSINDPWFSMKRGLNTNRDSVDGDWEKFVIQGFEDNLETGKKVGFKSVRTDAKLKWLNTDVNFNSEIPDWPQEAVENSRLGEQIEECSTIRNENRREECIRIATQNKALTIGEIVIAYNTLKGFIDFIRDVADTRRFEWIHANPKDEGTDFNEMVVKVSDSNGDDLIRYGDKIMFTCTYGTNTDNRACFKVRASRNYNPVARMGIFPWKFDESDEKAQFVICDSEGKCDFGSDDSSTSSSG